MTHSSPPRSRWRLAAKVNWTLEVLGRRTDGYHEIRSWFVPIALADTLEVEVQAEDGAAGLVVDGPEAAGVPHGADNLLLRAERAWREAGGEAPPVRWRLRKRIPAGSGLGGGSADAAGALRALEHHATRRLGKARCAALALDLGSDVPFFLHGRGAELRGGRGEVLLASAPAPGQHLVVVVPPFSVSTAAVYAALQAPAFDGDPRPAGLPALPEEPGTNELEAAAWAAEPRLRDLAEDLAERWSFLEARWHLTGSGAAYFSLWPTLFALSGREVLAARLPRNFRVFKARILVGRAIERLAARSPSAFQS